MHKQHGSMHSYAYIGQECKEEREGEATSDMLRIHLQVPAIGRGSLLQRAQL